MKRDKLVHLSPNVFVVIINPHGGQHRTRFLWGFASSFRRWGAGQKIVFILINVQIAQAQIMVYKNATEADLLLARKLGIVPVMIGNLLPETNS